MSIPVSNQNAVPVGSFVAALNNGSNYIAEGFVFNRPTTRIRRPDIYGQPQDMVMFRAEETGSGILQISAESGASAVPLPVPGNYFDLAVPNLPAPNGTTGYPPAGTGAAGAERWVLDSVSEPFEAQGYRKVNVTCVLQVVAAP